MSSRQSRDSGYRGSLGDNSESLRHWRSSQRFYGRGPADRYWNDRPSYRSDGYGSRNTNGHISESSISRADEEMDDFGRQRRREREARREYPYNYDRRETSPRRSSYRRDRSPSSSSSSPYSRRGPSPPYSRRGPSPPSPPLMRREPYPPPQETAATQSHPPRPPTSPPPPPPPQDRASSSPRPAAPTLPAGFRLGGVPAKTRSSGSGRFMAGRNNPSAADVAIMTQQSEGPLPERQSKKAAISRITEIATDDLPLTSHSGKPLSENPKNVRKRQLWRAKRAATDAASIAAVAAALPVENGTSQPAASVEASIEPPAQANSSAENPNADSTSNLSANSTDPKSTNPNSNVTGDSESKKLADSIQHIVDQLRMAATELQDGQGQLEGPQNTVLAMAMYLKNVAAGIKRLKATRVKVEKSTQK